MTNLDARRARRRAQLTQAEIAEQLGMSMASYHEWERGRRALPWERTVHDVMEAIRILAERKSNPDQ